MDDLELIKQKINIVDLIQEYLPLKKAGVNFKANCPFHQEKTPSFVVSPERGIFHCFGCGAGGDIFKFLMLNEGVEFTEALEVLATKAGIVLKRRQQSTDKRTRLFEANQKASDFFHYILTKHRLGKKALNYLQKRGVSEQTISDFKLGYAPNSWDCLSKFLLKRGFSIPELVEAGLMIPSKNHGYDRFRGRVMFPLLDVKNQIIGFAGRVLEAGEPKYINTPITPIFDKSKFLFGLNLSKGEIRTKKQAILVEGEMDMILSFQTGVKNIVATKGTALTFGQIELVKRYTDTISLCFDKDLAGDSASRRGIEMADQAGMNIKVIQIKEGKDPAELCLKDVKLWTKAVEEAEPIYDYYLRSVSMRYNSREAEGKKRIALELIPIWSKISDPLTFEHYLQKLSALLAVEEDILRKEIKKANLTAPAVFKAVLEKEESKSGVVQRSRQEMMEEYLLALLLKIPPSLVYVPAFPESIFLSEGLRTAYILLVLYLDAISFQARSFNIDDFAKSLPPELIPVIDRLYLTETDEKLQGARHWQQEVDKVVSALKKGLIRATLEKLSLEIKNAQAFGKIEILNTLNKRFRDLSVKLKNL